MMSKLTFNPEIRFGILFLIHIKKECLKISVVETVNSQFYNLPSNSFQQFVFHIHACLPLLRYLFSFAPFTSFASFFSPCFPFAPPPPPSPLALFPRCRCVTDRCCIPFGFPLQLYSPGNWAQLLSQGAADFHRHFEEPTPSSAVYIIARSLPPSRLIFLPSSPH